MNRLVNKVAVITGASSGIGLACAKLLAAQGVHLVLLARRLDRISKLAAELVQRDQITAYAFELDVRDLEAVKRVADQVYQRFEHIDILVNNAGLALGLTPLARGNEEDWSTMIDTNIKGVLYVTKAFLKSFEARSRGDIVNISSIAGRVMYPKGNVYAMTKFAVKALSRSLKLEFQNTDVRVIDIAPGQVETEFSLVRFKGDEDQAKAIYEKFTPLSPEDIAEAVVFALNCPAHMMVSEMVVNATRQGLQLV